MNLKLKNGFMSIEVSTMGGELQSICDRDGVERMHDGNPEYWNGRSPILFPIVSRLKDDTYFYNKKRYHMGLHGFARHKEFRVVRKDDTRIVLKLTDDEETSKSYPFHFEFFVTYALFKNGLTVTYKVVNNDDKEMFFMVGGHPGFKVPLYNRRERFTDYYLEFEENETVNKVVLDGKYLSLKEEPFLNNQKTITLKPKMFNPDAYVMNGLSSKYIDLKSRTHSKYIRFYFDQYKTLALWSPLSVDAPFVCIEPWQGLARFDSVDIEKKGTLSLLPNKEYQISYKVEVY